MNEIKKTHYSIPVLLKDRQLAETIVNEADKTNFRRASRNLNVSLQTVYNAYLVVGRKEKVPRSKSERIIKYKEPMQNLQIPSPSSFVSPLGDNNKTTVQSMVVDYFDKNKTTISVIKLAQELKVSEGAVRMAVSRLFKAGKIGKFGLDDKERELFRSVNNDLPVAQIDNITTGLNVNDILIFIKKLFDNNVKLNIDNKKLYSQLAEVTKKLDDFLEKEINKWKFKIDEDLKNTYSDE